MSTHLLMELLAAMQGGLQVDPAAGGAITLKQHMRASCPARYTRDMNTCLHAATEYTIYTP